MAAVVPVQLLVLDRVATWSRTILLAVAHCTHSYTFMIELPKPPSIVLSRSHI
jgi:hypothetical protein